MVENFIIYSTGIGRLRFFLYIALINFPFLIITNLLFDEYGDVTAYGRELIPLLIFTYSILMSYTVEKRIKNIGRSSKPYTYYTEFKILAFSFLILMALNFWAYDAMISGDAVSMMAAATLSLIICTPSTLFLLLMPSREKLTICIHHWRCFFASYYHPAHSHHRSPWTPSTRMIRLIGW